MIKMNFGLNINFIQHENMSKRITIVLDDDLEKKLRALQAKTIAKTNQSCSFSKVINDILKQKL